MEFRPNLLVVGLNVEKGSFPKCNTLFPSTEFNCRYKLGYNDSITFPSSYISILGTKGIPKHSIICSDFKKKLNYRYKGRELSWFVQFSPKPANGFQNTPRPSTQRGFQRFVCSLFFSFKFSFSFSSDPIDCQGKK